VNAPGGPGTAAPVAVDLARIQRRTVWVLASGQVLGGLGLGATLSLGALLAEQVSGDASWSGMAATMATLGAAGAAIPLARLASRKGRAASLATGSVIAGAGATLAIVAAAVPSFPLLLLALALLGSGSAANLQARFAASDLADAAHRGRDLSLVVWSTTIGAVLGPNLVGPGELFGAAFGLPTLTGPFVFTVVAQIAAASLYLVALRPDPLLLRDRLTADVLAGATGNGGREATVDEHSDVLLASFAIATVALSHATMVSVMAMTPVHLTMHGASITIVGLVISLHIAGMYALSPLFGILSDRLGRVRTILVSQGILAAALLTTAIGADSQVAITVGLILLGVGWSAATVSGSALLTDSVTTARRTTMQGRSDLIMNLAGATGAALAGPTLAWLTYSGLSTVAGGLVSVVIISAVAIVVRRHGVAR
jgi:MFS family permease